MHLKSGENFIKEFHHHPVPFVFRAIKIAIVSLPFFLVASFFQNTLPGATMTYIYSGIALIFALLIVHDGVLFFWDKLIITNTRIVHVNWKSLFKREESEVELADIQDIDSVEKGILSNLKLFDYGLFRIETASSMASIVFTDVTDPEGIKDFIYHLQVKPSKIEPISSSSQHDSKTKDSTEEKTSIG
jgi:hypothetical protein